MTPAIPIVVPPNRGKIPCMNLDGIDHVAMSVSDVGRSLRWYIEVLGFERRYQDAWGGIPAFVGKGTTALALFSSDSNEPASSFKPAGPHILHLA